MAGHSKWANIKHRKMAQDAKRGKLFNKLIREITVAARLGGGDPEKNPRLRAVVEKAKEANMPWDTIDKAIKRGTGELEGVAYEETVYEGYGPGGVAFMITALTDNKNRTTAEIKKIFNKYNGSLGESGSVSWIFERKGYIQIDAKKYSENDILEIALEAGAEDVKTEEDTITIYTSPEDFSNVLNTLKEKGIEISVAEVSLIPKTTVRVEGENAEKVLKLMAELEDHDDVQSVSANFDIDSSVIEKILQ